MKERNLFLLPLLLCTSLGFAAENSMPPFESSVSPIPAATQEIMKKYTWKPNCPVPLSDLAEVKLSYWGFDHKAHQGILVVNKVLANEVVSIFKALYYHQFPIERMEPMEKFKGDDDAAMQVNNTSAFNCRPVTGQPGVFSQHSYGRAIDINTMINPYVKGNQVLPESGRKYVDRTQYAPGKITKNSFIYAEFTKYDWDWGGNWRDLQDYQHFEKRANHEKRNIYGYPTKKLTTTAIAEPLQSQKIPCSASDLSFSVDYKNGYFNGMSHSGALLVLHNKGSKDCSIAARPIVGFEDAQQTSLSISWQPPEGMHPGPVLLPIIVPKNAWVTSEIRWVSSPVFDKNKCLSPAFITVSLGNDLLRSPFNGNLCGPADKNPTYTLTLFKNDRTYSPP